MTTQAPPIFNPENQLNETFNANAFHHNGQYATLADLLNYGNLYSPNNWLFLNTFNDLQAQTINGITRDAFALISYIPNMILDLTNVSYDSNTSTTSISHTTNLIDTNIQNNLNVATNLNCDSIINTSLINQNINTNNLSCKHLIINKNTFYDTVATIYINGLSMPLVKSISIDKFNITNINSLFITVKMGFRIDFIDVNNQILFSITNATNEVMYYQQIPYNTNMITINVYDIFNQIIN